MKLLVTHEVDANGTFCDGCIHYMNSRPDPETEKTAPVCNLFHDFLTADPHGNLFRCEACMEAEARANKVAASAARQRRAIDTIVDLYNEGKDEERCVRWDEADEDFVDPNAGEWRPYLLQTWHRDLIATFETTSDLIALLKSLDWDEALREPEAEVDTAWWDTWCSYSLGL